MDSVNTTDTLTNVDLFLNGVDQELSNLGVMAANIAFYNFQWRYITLVVFFSVNNSHAVDVFLNRYSKSVSVKLGKFRPLHRSHIPQYVLFGEESSDITEYLKWLVEMDYDNTGKFLLICYSADYQKCNETTVFKILDKILIVNVIFLRISGGYEPALFTYQVILPGICHNNKPQKMVNIRNGCVNDSCFKNIYREGIFDMQKCPLIVSTFENPPFMYLHNGTMEPTGGDGEMLKIVTSALNATLVIKTPADGDDWGHYIDNNWTGSMGDVFNHRAHISVCSLPLTTSRYGNFQVSSVYNTMDIVWVARLPDLKPAWEKLLHPFHYHARVALFATFIFVMMLSGFTRTHTWRKVRKSFNIDNIKQSLIFYSWAIFLGISVVRVPSKGPLIILVYSWIWFCFVMRSCYQADLINSLRKNIYEIKFESFHDVVEAQRPYGGQGTYREYFVDEKRTYNKWKQLTFNSAYEMLAKISNGTSDFVLASNKEIIIEYLLYNNGKQRLQMIPQKIINSPSVMYLKKYSPLTASLNVVLSRAIESGYASAWHMRFVEKRKVLFHHEETRGSVALNLENFSGCIMLTVFGWALSILFFIIEVYCGRMEEYYD